MQHAKTALTVNLENISRAATETAVGIVIGRTI
jgi:hypothetical protein